MRLKRAFLFPPSSALNSFLCSATNSASPGLPAMRAQSIRQSVLSEAFHSDSVIEQFAYAPKCATLLSTA